MLSKSTQEVGVVAAALLHDIVEDSRDNQRFVDLYDIEILFGYLPEKDRNTLIKRVDALTKVRKQIKSITFSNSITKIIEAEDTAVLFIKVKDRLHNMRTLFNFRNTAKEREIALETIGIFAPIAYYSGFIDEYHELMDLSVQVLKPDLLSQIHPSQKLLFFSNEMSKAIFEDFTASGVTIAEIRPSKIHEIISILDKTEKMELFNKLSFTTVNAFFPDELAQSTTTTADVIARITNFLLQEEGYTVPGDGETGFSAMHQQLKSNPDLDYPIAITLMKNNSYITFLYWKESRYKEMQLSFSQATSVEPVSDTDARLLQWKKRRFLEMFQATKAEGDVNTPWLFGNLLQKPNFIQISSKNHKDEIKIPLSDGATVMDLLLLGVEQWEYVKTVIINGNPVDTYKTQLFANDTVEVEFSEEPYINPLWFHDVKSAEMCLGEFRKKLLEHETYLEKQGDKDKKQDFQEKMNILGMNIVQASIGKPVRINVERVLKNANITNIPISTIFRDIALSLYDQSTLDRIIQAFESYQHYIKKISVTVSDMSNVMKNTWVLFDKHLEEILKTKGIDDYTHDRVDFFTRWDEQQQFVMESYYDTNDPYYSYIMEAYQRLSEDGYTIILPK